MTTARKVINKIRHKFKRPEKPEDPLLKVIAETEAKKLKVEFWERDKKIVRDDNFKKALHALELMREEQRKEKERQAEIAEQRLKNLKKARRTLARKRNK